MTEAPKRIWAVNYVDKTHERDAAGKYWNSPVNCGKEYHLARPDQPCADREFIERLWSAANRGKQLDNYEAMRRWLAGDFTAAMEGLE